MAEKRCVRCGQTKAASLAEFAAMPKCRDGLSSWCRVCHRDYVRQWALDHPDRKREHKRRAQEKRVPIPRPESKTDRALREGVQACSKCHITKPLDQFARHRTTRLGRTGQCRSCMAQTTAIYHATHPRDQRGAPHVEVVCVRCGHVFMGHPDRRYCSRECNSARSRQPRTEKRCLHCGVAFIGTPGRKFCTPLHALRYHTQQRVDMERALGRGSPKVERIFRDRIYERDGWRCQICHHKVVRGTDPRSPMGPSLDHIVPLSRGGSHTEENVQLAHLRCNMRKSASGPGQLRLAV